jgi:hypothetical protein
VLIGCFQPGNFEAPETMASFDGDSVSLNFPMNFSSQLLPIPTYGAASRHWGQAGSSLARRDNVQFREQKSPHYGTDRTRRSRPM